MKTTQSRFRSLIQQPKMSSKQSTSKPDPRIAKKEVMVTRHKSAQMKRQLRVKDRSMKHITDLLKSPTKETQTKTAPKTKSPPKLKQSLLKSIEKVQKLPERVFRLSKVLRKKVASVQDEEYYPNKRKRKVEVNRVVLKPTHDLKLVGGITGSVKRKYCVPQKASAHNPTPPKAPSPVYAELSMAEILRIVEDDLTDEDMMEILTCPSPVWWEDPPDEEYIEDAIFRRTPEPIEVTQKEPEEKLEKVEVPADKPMEMNNLGARGDKFLKKRSKLEGLLSHLKKKTNTKLRQSERNVFSEDMVVLCSGHRRNNDNIEVSDKVRQPTLSESDGDDIFHDSSMNVEEFLNDLENMAIPIENAPSDVIVIEDDEPKKEKKKPKKEVIKMKNGPKDKLNVLKNKPTFKKYKFHQYVPPKQCDGSTSKTCIEVKDIRAVSDTNEKFQIDEEQSKIETVKNKNEVDKNLQIFQVTDKPIKTQDVIGNLKGDIKIEEKERINDYYKTCKKVPQRKIVKQNEVDKTDINKNVAQTAVKEENDTFMLCEACKPQTKKVSDDKNVKYCLKCSSIFDSTDCAYCIEKSKSNVYKCVSCKMKFCCEGYFNLHTLSHLELGMQT